MEVATEKRTAEPEREFVEEVLYNMLRSRTADNTEELSSMPLTQCSYTSINPVTRVRSCLFSSFFYHNRYRLLLIIS